MLGQRQESSVKKISLSVSLLFLAAVLGLGAGCVKKPDDAKIAGDIQSKFGQDSGLSGKQLTVQASEGTVTLGGTVDSDSQREAASRQAASVPGVKQVINNLQVGTSMAASAPPPATEATSSPSSSTRDEPVKLTPSKKSPKARRIADSSRDSAPVEPAQTSSNSAPAIAPPPVAVAT